MVRRLTIYLTGLPRLIQDIIITILVFTPSALRYYHADTTLDPVLLIAILAIMIWYVVRRYSDELQKDKDKILNILGQVSELSDFPNETGVLLYLPRWSFLGELILKPILTHNKDGFPDESIEFRYNSGCTGQCWGEAKQVMADLDHPEAALEEETIWNMDDEQVENTKHLKAVLSTPILDANAEVIGVLTIDCLRSPEDSGIRELDFWDAANRYAERLGRMIEARPL